MIPKGNLTKMLNTLLNEGNEQIETNNIAGMAVALVQREGIIWAQGFGHTDNSRQQAATPDSLFNLQSSGKMINTAAFLRVMQQGLVNLDTHLIDIYPEFHLNDRYDGQQYKKITYRHLLSHHAGLTHESPHGGNWDNRDIPFEDIIASINGTWMVAPVGQEHRYSNCGMSLMLYGLQRATGKPVRELIRQEVIQPLQLDSMVFGKPAALKHAEYVTGYDGDAKTLFESFSDLGAGCQYVSVRDFSNFIQMRLNHGQFNGEQYLDPELLAEARTPQFSGQYRNNSAGLGLFRYNNILPAEWVYGHAGGGCGYSGEVLWSLEHGFGVIVETNNESYGFPVALEYARKALAMAVEAKGVTLKALEPPRITNRPKQAIDLEMAQKLAGEYVYFSTRVQISMENDQLTYTLHGEQSPLTHHGDLVFTADNHPGIKFILEEDANPDHLLWLNSEGEYLRFYYDKISGSEPTINPNGINHHIGLYQGTVYGFRPYGAIRRSGSHLEISFFRFSGKLEQHAPGLFFTPDGEHVRFEGNSAWFSNRRVEKVNHPLDELHQLEKEDPTNYMLNEYNLNKSLIPMLKFLERDAEIEAVRDLSNRLYTKEGT